MGYAEMEKQLCLFNITEDIRNWHFDSFLSHQ